MLAPGYVWLSGTARHRTGSINQSSLEEFLLVVVVGAVFLAPAVLAAAVLFPGCVLTSLHFVDAPTAATAAQLQKTAILTFGVEAAAIGLAFGCAWGYRKRKPQISGESVWFDVLGQVPEGAGLYIDIELLDGRMVRGQLEHFDGTATGRGRDLAIRAEMLTTASGKVMQLPGGTAVVSEHEIRTLTVQVVDSQGNTFTPN